MISHRKRDYFLPLPDALKTLYAGCAFVHKLSPDYVVFCT